MITNIQAHVYKDGLQYGNNRVLSYSRAPMEVCRSTEYEGHDLSIIACENLK